MWIAIAGIIGTLLAPLLHEVVRRRSVRDHEVLVRRMDTYADLLQATARFADNAQTWSAIPLADLEETEDEKLNRLLSEVRVHGSKAVYASTKRLSSALQEFNRRLWHARAQEVRMREAQEVDDVGSIRARMDAGKIADACWNSTRRSRRRSVSS